MSLKRISFFSILLTLIVLNIFDAFITLYWIENKLAVEANPLMKGWIDIGPSYFIGLKLSIVLLGSLLLWKTRHRKLTYFLLMPTLAIYFYIFLKHLSSLWETIVL